MRASANLAEGRTVAATILRHPPPHTANLRVWHVLRAIPRIGPREAERILAAEGLHDRHVLGQLTERQRHALADLLDPVGVAVAA